MVVLLTNLHQQEAIQGKYLMQHNYQAVRRKYWPQTPSYSTFHHMPSLFPALTLHLDFPADKSFENPPFNTTYSIIKNWHIMQRRITEWTFASLLHLKIREKPWASNMSNGGEWMQHKEFRLNKSNVIIAGNLKLCNQKNLLTKNIHDFVYKSVIKSISSQYTLDWVQKADCYDKSDVLHIRKTGAVHLKWCCMEMSLIWHYPIIWTLNIWNWEEGMMKTKTCL